MKYAYTIIHFIDNAPTHPVGIEQPLDICQGYVNQESTGNLRIHTYPRHSMYGIFADQLGWFSGSIDRHIFQFHGLSGYLRL